MPVRNFEIFYGILSVFFMMPLMSMCGDVPQIVAHRGASHDAPENTLPAVMLAWEKNADATEVDVHMTRDHQIVVIHDSSSKRTTGSDFKISEVDYAQLMHLDAGMWKSSQYQGTRIPLLSDVLGKIPEGKKVFIEIKCPDSVLPHLKKVVAESGLSNDQAVFIAFDWETIRKAKLFFPDCSCFWLSGFKQDATTKKWKPDPLELIRGALDAGVDGVDVHYKGPVDKKFVDLAHSKGLEVHVYTVNEVQDARRMMDAGVDGITSDRPAYLRNGLTQAEN